MHSRCITEYIICLRNLLQTFMLGPISATRWCNFTLKLLCGKRHCFTLFTYKFYTDTVPCIKYKISLLCSTACCRRYSILKLNQRHFCRLSSNCIKSVETKQKIVFYVVKLETADLLACLQSVTQPHWKPIQMTTCANDQSSLLAENKTIFRLC